MSMGPNSDLERSSQREATYKRKNAALEAEVARLKTTIKWFVETCGLDFPDQSSFCMEACCPARDLGFCNRTDPEANKDPFFDGE